MSASRLTAAAVRTAKPGRYCDGDGLYLLVKKSGSRFWVYRYRLAGIKMREAGLGRAGDGRNCVSLSDARDRASVFFRQVKAGIDPLAAKKDALVAAKAAAQDKMIRRVTFRETAARYVESHAAGWRNAKHKAQWSSTIETYANPVLGDIATADIATEHVLAVLDPIWRTKPETASRLRGRIEAVLDFARARGWRSGENPAAWKGHLDQTLPARSKVKKVEHHAALPFREIGDFMSQLQEQAGIGARALRFAILTAARSGEVREATWKEIDFETATWVIPADRMKAGKEHRVPLSAPALTILREMSAMRTNTDPEALVLPGRDPKRPLSDMSLTAVLRRMKRGDLTAHGFRSTFRDWAAETTSYPAEIVEMALAHTVGNKVEAAYRRGDLFEKRRRLMADYGTYCSMPSAPPNATVTLLRGVRQ